MAQIDPMKTALNGVRLATMVAVISAMNSSAGAASVPPIIGRNPSNFVLKLDNLKFVAGGWTGDANFEISACPQPSCFHLAGPVKIVSSPKSEVTDYEGYFAIPSSACVIHFEEVSRNGMDSGDYRLTLVTKGHEAESCNALPAGLAGVYRQNG